MWNRIVSLTRWVRPEVSVSAYDPSEKLVRLPLEVLQSVLRCCSKGDVLSLAQTSKCFHGLCIPFIYGRVDLSFHNDDGRWISVAKEVESDSPERPYDERVVSIERKQLSFIRSILLKPEYATYIRSLAWTYQTLGDEGNKDNRFKEDPMWRCFKLMENIRALDFCSITLDREIHTPPPLFSSVQTLRLGGPMSFALATSILCSVDPSLITSLELNNLQDIGQLRKGKSLLDTENLSHLRETRYPNGNPKVRHPGPMRDHLRRLNGRCCALKRLVLRSVGQDHVDNDMWSGLLDEARYQEWASFLESVRPTLQIFYFEQGIPPQSKYQGGCSRSYAHGPDQTIRPMDARFIENIVPVLTQGSWPALKEVITRGIGGQVQEYHQLCHHHDALERVAASKSKLERALQPSITLIFQEEAGNTFYHRDRTNSYR